MIRFRLTACSTDVRKLGLGDLCGQVQKWCVLRKVVRPLDQGAPHDPRMMSSTGRVVTVGGLGRV